jgi:hypothetical protein
VSTFLVLLSTVLILWRLGSNHSNGYIVQYRANLGISAFQTGRISDLLAFIVFSFLVLSVHIVLSLRIYPVHRQFAITVLGIGLLLLTLCLIVSNALLVLR